MASTTRGERRTLPKRKHKLLIEVLDDIPSSEEHYSHNIRDEIDTALARINLKVTWMKVYPLETRERSSLETKHEP